MAAAPLDALAIVHDKRGKTSDVDAGWGLDVQSSFSLRQGNSDFLSIGASAQVDFTTLVAEQDAESLGLPPLSLHSRLLFSASGFFARSSGITNASRSFGYVRYNRMITPRWGLDAFGQLERNAFVNLTLRSIAGLGATYILYETETLSIRGATDYLVEHERVSDNVDAADPHFPSSTNHRWNNSIMIELKVPESTLLIRNTAYMQPSFTDFGDYRFLEALDAEVPISENVRIGLTLQWHYDSDPPVAAAGLRTIEKADLRLINSLSIKL